LPKLANSTADIFFPTGHSRKAWGPRYDTMGWKFPLLDTHEFTFAGSLSSMKLQIVSLFTFNISTCPGSIGCSSNITSKLSCGFRNALGMWNLNQWCKVTKAFTYGKTKTKFSFLVQWFTYSDWVGFPSGERKLIQWRPMLLPLTQINPLPIPVILMATGPVPSGVANLVCKIKA